MADKVGSMEVEYSVIVGEAIKNLNKYNKLIEKNNKEQNEVVKVEKKRQKSISDVKKGWALLGATATGALYGLIKASSYASIYTAQFSATTQQLADTMMEKTGVNKSIEDFNREFQVFVDRIAAGDKILKSITLSLITFGEWFKNQSNLIKFLTILGTMIIVIGAIIGILGTLSIASAAVAGGWAVLAGAGAWLAGKFIIVKGVLAGVIKWFMAGSVSALALAAAIGILIGMVGVWLLQKTGILDWFSDLFSGYREWDSWIKDITTIIAAPLALFGAAIIDIVNGDLGFPMLIGGLNTIYDTIVKLIDRVQDLINWIAKIPPKISFGGGATGGEGFGGGWGDPEGGGEWSSSRVGDAIIAPGGKIITTNPADYLIATKTPGDLGGKGGNTYNIAPVINISSTGSNNDISRQVSKAIADEIKRMTKI